MLNSKGDVQSMQLQFFIDVKQYLEQQKVDIAFKGIDIVSMLHFIVMINYV